MSETLTMKVIKRTAPANWACYLYYGRQEDFDIDENERKRADAFAAPYGECVSVDNEHNGIFEGQYCALIDYTFYKHS